jgi:hypothetical protein
MHSLCIRVDSLLSARECTAPIHSPGSHPNTSLLSAPWTPARMLRPSHIGRHIPGAQLLPQAVRGATSARIACTLREESPRRTGVHFFPHTRPPDTHSHLSPHHLTPPLDSGAAVEYQGPLVNTYFSLVLSSMPRQRRASRSHHLPPVLPGSAMTLPRDDEASETTSVDGARDMSTSFAREGSGDFDSREGSGGLDSRRQDRDPSPFQVTRGAARGGFAFGSSRRHGMAPPARRPMLVEAQLASATLKNAAASGRKQTSPPTTLSASAACRNDVNTGKML